MAEISTETQRRKSTGNKKLVRQSTRIDLTPMVDLGFLLITFFIFSTTISRPKVMKLVLPNDTDVSMPTKESGVLTLLLGANNSVYYYEGKLNPGALNFHNATFKELRQIVINKKKKTAEKDMFIIIKGGQESVYQNIVDVIDEMTINDVKRYALTDISTDEERMMRTAHK